MGLCLVSAQNVFVHPPLRLTVSRCLQLLLEKHIAGWQLRALTGSGSRVSAAQWMSSVGSARSQLGGVVTVFGAFARHAGKSQPSPSIFDPVDCFHQSTTSLRRESTASVLS